MKGHICFFSGDITRSGGTERVAVSVANGLSRAGEYRVSILSMVEQARDKKPFFPLDEQISRYALGDRWIQPGAGYLPLIPRLRRFLKKNRVDILVDIDVVLDVLAVPAAAALPVRVVSWEHFNLEYEMSVGYRRFTVRHFTKRTDFVVTLTERDCAAYQRLFGRTERIRAVANPVSGCASAQPETGVGLAGEAEVREAEVGPAGEAEVREAEVGPAGEAEVREAETWSDDGTGDRLWERREKWIVTVGRLTYQKGMDDLVRVAGQVLAHRPDWKWLVVGEGEERAFLEDEIKKRGLSGRLILTGRTDDVGGYLKKARIFALTSRWEGLPMCLLEARVHGLACVSFDIATGPDELIEDGHSGFLVPAGDCGRMAERLLELMADGNLCGRMGRNASRGLARFRLDAVLRDWSEVLNQLCD